MSTTSLVPASSHHARSRAELLSETEQAALRALRAHQSADGAAFAAAMQQEVDRALRELGEEVIEPLPAAWNAALAAYFAQLTHPGMTLNTDEFDVEFWRDFSRLGVRMSWVTDLMGKFLALQSAVARRIFAGDSALQACASDALRNVVFAQLSVIGDTFVQRRRADIPSRLEGAVLPRAGLVNALRERLANQSPEAVLGVLVAEVEIGSIAFEMAATSHEDLIFECAQRLSGVLRPEDLLGRLDRNRFAIVLPALRSEGYALLAATKIERMLNVSLSLAGGDFPMRASLGLARTPIDGNDSEMLLHKAELARRESKRRGETYLVYDHAFGAEELRRKALEEELRAAVHDNDLMVYFQPQLDLRVGKVASAEALLRWKNRLEQLVAPNLVIEIAEQIGLMSKLSTLVLNSALRQCAALARDGFDLAVSVNLAAINLTDDELPDLIDQSLRTWGVRPSQLMIELTEGSLVRDEERTHVLLERLKAKGVRLSIDDFGTGYSSLAYLKHLPVDELKIDRGFVRNMLTDEGDQRIVRTVIDLAHNFDLEVVAEGVEDDATKKALHALHCDKIQGYLLAAAMPEHQFAAWLKSRT